MADVDLGFIILLVGTGFSVGVGAWERSRPWRLRAAMGSIARTQIARAPENKLLKIEGVVKYVEAPLTAPLTGRPCAAYQLVIEGVTLLVPVSDRESRDFGVEDETGRALVRAPVSMAILTAEAGQILEDDPKLEGYLAKKGIRARGRLFENVIRYREAILEEGRRVTVLGRSRWEIDTVGQFANYREAPRRLVLAAAGRTPLIVAQAPTSIEKRKT